MFSATISNDIDYLAKKYTRNAVEISVKSQVDPTKLKQYYYDVADNKKFSLLVHLLQQDKSDFVLVFCSTRRTVDFVTKNLPLNDVKARAIHGGLDQKKRLRVLDEFKKKGTGVLVCTDVAARGLDIPGVSHVYNYDIPRDSRDYIHRIGRTARAGKEGIAVSLLCGRDYENFSNVSRDEKLNITEVKLPLLERVNIIIEPKRSFGRRDSRQGFGGRSDSPSRGRSFSRGQSSNRKPVSRSRGNVHRGSNRSQSSGRGRSNSQGYRSHR
jgi:ATP-dependent RNA helicase DeaD